MSIVRFFGLGSIGHQMSLRSCIPSLSYVVLASICSSSRLSAVVDVLLFAFCHTRKKHVSVVSHARSYGVVLAVGTIGNEATEQVLLVGSFAKLLQERGF